MRMRNGVILSLTTLAGILLTWAVAEDPPAAKLVGAAATYLLAYVYAQVTKPAGWGGRDRG